MVSDVSASTASTSAESDRVTLKAVVRGAGPSGLAASIALAQSGFDVQVVEKRPSRPRGHGRKNMVALRPEALRQLDHLGALRYALSSEVKNGNLGCITRMSGGRTTSQIDGSAFEWPLKRYPGAEPPDSISNVQTNEYEIPDKINEQVPSSFINLGDLEDCLAQAATDLGVTVVYDAIVHLTPSECSNTFSATLERSTGTSTSLGTPDLVICASGKNDHALIDELDIRQKSCVILSDADLVTPTESNGPLALRLPADGDESLESQLYSVFGVQDRSLTMGTLEHVVRKHTSGPNHIPQPLVEIQMHHATAAHLILQHPRSDPPLHSDTQALEKYILERINARLSTTYTSVQHLKDCGKLVWGDPLAPITVETVTAPQFVYGDNTILIGDCAMSCNPSSGLGADIGVTVDSKSVRALAEAFRDANGNDQERIKQALAQFNRRKAESAVIWSQGSRMYYLTSREADDIVKRQAGGE